MKINVENIKYLKLCVESDNNISEENFLINCINENEMIIFTEDAIKTTYYQDCVVDLKLICYDGLYKAKSKILYVRQNEEKTVLYVEIPDSAEYIQAREYFRVLTEYPCFLIFDNGKIKTKTYDLSANGISIVTNKNMQLNEILSLEIQVGDKRINVTCTVVRSYTIKDEYYVACRFIAIKDNDRDYISKVCMQKQIEERRNRLN